jgi:phosphoribosylamine--glycine ligase
MINILVIGSGGREHALCWKIKQSPECGALYCSPGNGGIQEVANCVTLADEATIIAFCQEKQIGLVVIGPEQPLVDGLADSLRAANIPTFGPSKKAAQLEGSKAYTKKLCDRYHIPTAAYGEFTDLATAKNYLQSKTYPQVVKADGLAAGKGVVIAQNEREAVDALEMMFSGGFGAAGNKVVIEEFLEGPELSFFALSDGTHALEFGSAQDHKRAFDNDQGPNTGGMGTYSPPPIATKALHAEVMETIIKPTVAAMQAEGAPFQGVLFAGLILTKGGPKLLEYNTRFGDPETQVLMARLESDVLPILLACAKGDLNNIAVKHKNEHAVCVVMAANGYPANYEKNTLIQNLTQASALPNTVIFHAGTARSGGEIRAIGGRVLGVTATGATLKEAQHNAYKAVDAIDWPQGFCRRDIAASAL